MKERHILIVLVILIAGIPAIAQDFDPPRIIGILTSPQENQQGFASDFCWVGDQNGDGYDDLVVNQDRFPNDTLSHVYLFNGGDTITNQPAFTWNSYEEGLIIGREVVFLGQVDDNFPRIAFLSVKRLDVFTAMIVVDQYPIGWDPNSDPIVSMRGINWQSAPDINTVLSDHPKDFNNDGWDDLFMVRQTNSSPYLQSCWGGEDCDTIPDWSVYLNAVPWNTSSAVYISGGFDVNGDDINDILVKTRESGGDTTYYSIYLGGNPPDTIPALRIKADDYDLRDVFAMLPDVNGDGYDDWGISWLIPRGIDERSDGGIKIFFGGEEPDGEPDVTLLSNPIIGIGIYGLCGGDFNADGVGDIAYIDAGGFSPHVRRLSLNFGNRWIADDAEPDIHIANMVREYGENSGIRIGAVGDYNGDSIDDMVMKGTQRAIILAGNQNWQLAVPEGDKVPHEFNLELSITPNPFNNTATVSYSNSHPSYLNLQLYDLHGRLCQTLTQGEQPAGTYSTTLSPNAAGIYFLVLQSTDQRVIRKLVCVR